MSIFTKRHYEAIAEKLGNQIAVLDLSTGKTVSLLSSFEAMFAGDNPRFNPSKFTNKVYKVAYDRGWSSHLADR